MKRLPSLFVIASLMGCGVDVTLVAPPGVSVDVEVKDASGKTVSTKAGLHNRDTFSVPVGDGPTVLLKSAAGSTTATVTKRWSKYVVTAPGSCVAVFEVSDAFLAKGKEAWAGTMPSLRAVSTDAAPKIIPSSSTNEYFSLAEMPKEIEVRGSTGPDVVVVSAYDCAKPVDEVSREFTASFIASAPQ